MFLLDYFADQYISGITKNKIHEIVNGMKNSASSLVDASVSIAELTDIKEKNYLKLSQYFEQHMEKAGFSKAFFVLNDGKIMAHSSSSEAASLNYNIATDEFYYNLDQIFLPLKSVDDKVYITDYFILDYKIPFSKEEIVQIKNAYYSEVDRNGLLASRAVVRNHSKIGTVNFIFNKEKVYSEITSALNLKKRADIIIISASIILSFLFAVIIFLTTCNKQNPIISDFGAFNEEFKKVQREETIVTQNVSENFLVDQNADDRISRIDAVNIFAENSMQSEKFIRKNIPQDIIDAIPINRRSK